MVLKSDIRDAAYFAFRKSQIKAMMIERLDCIHVSDLIKPCMRNVIYNKETPEHSIDTEKMRPLFLGQAIHEVTDMSTPNIQGLPVTHELPLYYNWLHKSPCKKEDILNAVNKYDYITGKIDDIIEVNGELVICDKKTTGSIDYFKSRMIEIRDRMTHTGCRLTYMPHY